MKFSLKTPENTYKGKSIKMSPLNKREIHRHNGLKQSTEKSMIPMSLAINSRTNNKISNLSLFQKYVRIYHFFLNLSLPWNSSSLKKKYSKNFWKFFMVSFS